MSQAGILFDSKSFETFNKEVEKFNKISDKFDKKLKGVAGEINTFFRAMSDTSQLIKGSSTNNFKQFTKTITQLSGVMKDISSTQVSGDFTEKTRKVARAVKEMVKIFTDPAIVIKTGESRGIFGFFKRAKTDIQIFPSFLEKLDRLNPKSIDNFQKVIVGIEKSFKALEDAQKVNIDKKRFNEIRVALNELFEIFTSKGQRHFVFFRKNVGVLESLKNVDFGNLLKLGGLTKSLDQLSMFFSRFGKIDLDMDHLEKVKKYLTTIIGVFTGRGKFGLGRSQLGKLSRSSGGVKALGGLTSSLRRMVDSLNKVATMNLHESQIERMSESLKGVVQMISDVAQEAQRLGQGRRFLGLQIVRGIDTSYFDKLTLSFKRLSDIDMQKVSKNITLGPIGKQFAEDGEKAAKGFIEGFSKEMQISSPSRVFMRFGKFIVQGLFKGIRGSLRMITRAFGGLVNIGKNAAGKLVNAFRLGLRGLTSIARSTFRGVKRTITNAIGVGPIGRLLGAIRQRFIITFSDIQRGISTMFRSVIGNAVEFESSFAGVLKTLNLEGLTDSQSAEFINELRDGLRDLATDSESTLSGLENAQNQLAGIAESAGQLGIARDDILDFTEVVGQMTLATDLAAEDAAFRLARLSAVTGGTEFDRMGATIVGLGNQFAATESEITEFAQRIASSATVAGISEADILGFSAAMAAVGINAEAGGTSFNQLLNKMITASSEGGTALQQFANVSGSSIDEFRTKLEEDATGAILDFLGGIQDLSAEEQVAMFEEMGLDAVRLSQLVRSLGANYEGTARAIETANEAWEENNALTNEAQARSDTMQSAINRMKNIFHDVSITLGDALFPAFGMVLDRISEFGNALNDYIGDHADEITAFTTRFAEGLIAIAEFSFNAFTGIMRIGGGIASLIKNLIGLIPIGDQVANTFRAVGQNIRDFIGGIVPAIDRIASGLGFINNIIGGGKDLKDTFGAGRRAEDEARINTLLERREELMKRISGEGESQVEGLTHQFEVGDTLWQLAQDYGTTVDEILEFNDVTLEEVVSMSEIDIPVNVEGAEMSAAELALLEDQIDTIDQEIEELENRPRSISDIIAGDDADAAKREAVRESVERIKTAFSTIGTGFGEIASGEVRAGFDTIIGGANDAKDAILGMFGAVFGDEDEAIQNFDPANAMFGTEGAPGSGGFGQFASDIAEGFSEMDGSIIADALQENMTSIISVALAGLTVLLSGPIGLMVSGFAFAVKQNFLGLGDAFASLGIGDVISNAFSSLFGGGEDFVGGRRGAEMDFAGSGPLGFLSTFTDGISSFVDTVSAINFQPAVDLLNTLFGAVTAFAGPIAQAVWDNVTTLIPDMINLGVAIAGFFVDVFGGKSEDEFIRQAGAIGTFFADILNAAGDLYSDLLTGATEFFDGLSGTLTDFFENEWVQQIIGAVEDSLIGGFNELKDGVIEFVNQIGDADFSGIATFFTTVFGAIAGVITTVGGVAVGTVARILGRLLPKLGEFITEVADFFNALLDGDIEGVATALVNALETIITGLLTIPLTAIQSMIDFFIDTIGGTINTIRLEIESLLLEAEYATRAITGTDIRFSGFQRLAGDEGDVDVFGLREAIEGEMDEIDPRGLRNIAQRNIDDFVAAYNTALRDTQIIDPETQELTETAMIDFWSLAQTNTFDELAASMIESGDTNTLAQLFGGISQLSAEDLEEMGFGEQDIADLVNTITDSVESGLLEQDVGINLANILSWSDSPLGEEAAGGADAISQIGIDIATGMADGIEEGAEDVEESVNTLSSNTQRALIGSWGIDSPSKVTHGYGVNIIEGLIMGVTEMLPSLTTVFTTVENMIKGIKDSIDSLTMSITIFSETFLTYSPLIVADMQLLDFYTKEASDTVAILAERFGILTSAIETLAEMGTVSVGVNSIGGAKIPGRQFGGEVFAGKVYEILENDLPFELYQAGGKTYMLPGMNGNILSPAGMQIQNVNNNSTSVGGNTTVVEYNVNVDIGNIGDNVSEADIDAIREAVMDGVKRQNRSNSLSTRLTRSGAV